MSTDLDEQTIDKLKYMLKDYESDKATRKMLPSLIDTKIKDNNSKLKLEAENFKLKDEKYLRENFITIEALNRSETHLNERIDGVKKDIKPVIETHKDVRSFIKVSKWIASVIATVFAVVLGYFQLK